MTSLLDLAATHPNHPRSPAALQTNAMSINTILHAFAPALLPLVAVAAYPTTDDGCLPEGPLTVLSTLPSTQGLENIAIRSNGEILVTSLASSSVFLVSPAGDSEPVAVAEISEAAGLSGIVEVQEDVFYVVGLNLTGFSAAPGTTAVWEIDLRGLGKSGCANRAAVNVVAEFPDAGFFNGMTRMAANDTSHVLISDSSNGTITRLDVSTGQSDTVFSDEMLRFGQEGLPIGVNGIETLDGRLYFTNFNRGIFAAVPISPITGMPTGPVDIIAEGVSGDDFALAPDGARAWLAMNGQNTLVEVDVSGKTSSIVANSTVLSSITSAALGRGAENAGSLYITGAEAFANGTSVGRVIRADLAQFL